jgi:transglutaminase-like putative cysteine protease
MRRWIPGPVVLTAFVVANAAVASAQPPPCPPESTITIPNQSIGEQSTSSPYPINLEPCQTVVVEMTATTASHPSGNANMELDIRNATGDVLAQTIFVCGPSCTQSVPLNGSVSGYPLPGTRGSPGLAKDVIVKAGFFNWFGHPPATYTLTIRKKPRPGYNIGGDSTANAPLVQLPTMQYGSLHPNEVGQFYKIHLESQQGFYASGFVRGHSSWGPYYEIDVLNSAGTQVSQLHYGTAYGGPHQYSSRNPFINTGASAADFYVKIWTRFWPLWDFGLNIVPFTITNEVTEVGFKTDHLLTRWSDKRSIDSPDGTMPTWIKGRSDNDAAAYTQGAHPALFAIVAINPPFTSSRSVNVRVKKDGTIVGTRTGLSFSGATGIVDALVTDVDFESSPGVQASDYEYWTYGPPIAPPFTNIVRETGALFDPTYDLALQKTTEAAQGSADTTEIKQRLNTTLEQLFYDPSVSVIQRGHHPLEVYDQQRGQCDDFAHLMRGLLRSVGIGAETFYVWGGGSGPSGIQPFWYQFYLGAVTFRVQRPDEDGVGVNPHFTFHAVVGDAVTGVLYDPSYGVTATGPLVGLDETLDTPTGPFVNDPALVREVWSTILNLSPRPTPPLLVCPHTYPGRPFAGFVDQSVPSSMTAGQIYPVTVTFRNTGTAAWQTNQDIVLRLSDTASSSWSTVAVTLPNIVPVDGEVTFTFNITAPSVLGTYPLSFRLQAGGIPFGGRSDVVNVTVQ